VDLERGPEVLVLQIVEDLKGCCGEGSGGRDGGGDECGQRGGLRVCLKVIRGWWWYFACHFGCLLYSILIPGGGRCGRCEVGWLDDTVA